MAKSKKGPPYNDNPGCKFIIVINPWGVASCSHRKQHDFNVLGAWIRFMLRGARGGRETLVEVIYSRSTEDQVIVQLPEDVDIVPFLGQHKWFEFLLRPSKPSDRDGISYMFPYNYRMHGDPGNHNWTAWYPTDQLPPSNFPIKIPYPKPTWVELLKSMSQFALQLPHPKPKQLPVEQPLPPPPPTPPLPSPLPLSPKQGKPPHEKEQPPPEQEQQPPQQPVQNEPEPSFVPYERPGQLDGIVPRADSLEPEPSVRVKAEEEPSIQPLFVDKVDPYEAEDAALALLRSFEPMKEELVDESLVKQEPDASIKLEHLDAYRPSDDLISSLATLQGRHIPQRTHLDDYQPSNALIASLATLRRPQISQSAHPEGRSNETKSPPTKGPRLKDRVLNKRIKSEDEDDHTGLIKKVKLECM